MNWASQRSGRRLHLSTNIDLDLLLQLSMCQRPPARKHHVKREHSSVRVLLVRDCCATSHLPPQDEQHFPRWKAGKLSGYRQPSEKVQHIRALLNCGFSLFSHHPGARQRAQALGNQREDLLKEYQLTSRTPLPYSLILAKTPCSRVES